MKRKTRQTTQDAYYNDRCADAASDLHAAIVARAGHLPTDEEYEEAWNEWCQTMAVALRDERVWAEREAE